MDDIRRSSFGEQRYHAILFSSLAGLALLLSSLGIYGLVAQSVTQRTREMGIRLALGASLANVLKLAVIPGIAITTAGILAGLVLGLFAARLLTSILWGVSTSDPFTLAAVVLLLLVTALTAGLIPAWRLTKLDPARTLRDE
jgi:ABC-type antimicrobial peptide transport system permease subunit